MAASMPFPFSAQIPATPPPEQAHMFTKPFPPQPPKPSPLELNGWMGNNNKAQTKQAPPQPSPTTPALPTMPTMPSMPNTPSMPMGSQPLNFNELAGDPRYLAMASRIASYYQQRCQAVTAFQHQRCQAWATMQRQKCQEMMQAAMLIVAWYVRDRISRRRKRQKRVFKRRLSEKCSRSKITKGESVRRWVLDVPLGDAPPTSSVHDTLVDEDEAKFSMDKEQTPDKDSHLFSVADNLIKSQHAKIDIPLLGALSFDESDSESEDEDIRDYDDDDDEEEQDDEDEDEEYEDGDEAAENGHHEENKHCEPGMGSEEVQPGTSGKGSGKQSSAL
ncbi:hypothetical protein B0T19DRAFT_396795 [Cercophora scortea]|uniref:Uncharacterized protein n=1 Tax=Cercophora scortea TaxID=314031 RepID=A0AAE0J574_9PEZI|nr:hypothetical protein B0T19DRAFT_396795 [Cercophora scortea]